jgi:SAM-dependent methyltransferase
VATSPAEPPTAFTDQQYADPYPPGIEHGYWHQARNRILVRRLLPVVGREARILDIGCGPGIVVDHLRRAGLECAGVDLGAPPPATAEVAPHLTLSASAFDLPAATRAAVTVLLLMDVLEHLPAPADFLAECRRAFPAAKHVFVTLPARMEIWSSYDEHYGHYKRYTLEEVPSLLARTDLRVVESGYFFHALYAAARVLAVGTKKRSHVVKAPRLRLPQTLLARLFVAEQALLPSTAPGSSLYALLAAP